MKKCLCCGTKYKPKRLYHLFCSYTCRNRYNVGKTWEAYFASLIRKTSLRKNLTPEILTKLLTKQKGKCRLTGVELTKIQGKGTVTTNASIDRIRPGKSYHPSNIRLVCNFINSFRGNVSDKEFKWWCAKVVENGGKA